MTLPEDRETERRAGEQLQESGVCEPFEKEYVRGDGVRVPILLGSAALPGSGADGQLVTFVLDISDRKRIERGLSFLSKVSMFLASSLELRSPSCGDRSDRAGVADGCGASGGQRGPSSARRLRAGVHRGDPRKKVHRSRAARPGRGQTSPGYDSSMASSEESEEKAVAAATSRSAAPRSSRRRSRAQEDDLRVVAHDVRLAPALRRADVGVAELARRVAAALTTLACSS